MATFFEKKYFYRVLSNLSPLKITLLHLFTIFVNIYNTLNRMNLDIVYESPEIYTIEIQGEGLLCSSTEFGNESLDENEGIW